MLLYSFRRCPDILCLPPFPTVFLFGPLLSTAPPVAHSNQTMGEETEYTRYQDIVLGYVLEMVGKDLWGVVKRIKGELMLVTISYMFTLKKEYEVYPLLDIEINHVLLIKLLELCEKQNKMEENEKNKLLEDKGKRVTKESEKCDTVIKV